VTTFNSRHLEKYADVSLKYERDNAYKDLSEAKNRLSIIEREIQRRAKHDTTIPQELRTKK
jgi:hypothetical protein